MKLRLSQQGDWEWDVDDPSTRGAILIAHEAYVDAVPRYFKAFEELFSRAQEHCEFEFILSLLRIKGSEDSGWDPYETTTDAFSRIGALLQVMEDFQTRRHLELWLYGHMVEATEPHGLIANMLGVALGERYRAQPFPPKRSRGGSTADLTAGERIRRIANLAVQVELPDVALPLTESWDRVVRNAVHHSDYCIHGDEVRVLKPARRYLNEEWLRLLNRAAAYHESLTQVHQAYVASYDAPRIIDVHPDFGLSEKAEVLVEAGHGLTGLKDPFTPSQIRAGAVPWRIGRPLPS